MKDSVTFVVKGTNDYNQVIRCLSSINRQNNSNYKVIVLSDIEEINTITKKQFPNYKFIKIENEIEFPRKFNELIESIETEYLTIVNFDEILAPNTVDYIVSKDYDMIIFNASRLMINKKFKPFYSTVDEFTFKSYLSIGSMVWNNAIKIDVIKKNSIKLKGLNYCQQALFVLTCFAYSDTHFLTNYVLVYREKLTTKKPITYAQFKNNRGELKRILKIFEKKNMNSIRKIIVCEFVVVHLKVLYNEKSYLKRIYKKLLLRRYMGL